MANLPESPQWADGVYQIERNDPVGGGPDGVANKPLKDLTNRTRWLYEKFGTAFDNLGWMQLGEWAVGLEVSLPTQIVYYNGSWYRYRGNLDAPHVIAGESPEEDGGVWSGDNPDGMWVDVGDASLRADLESSDGASLIGTTTGRRLNQKLHYILSADDYGFCGDLTGDKSADFAAMLSDASERGIKIINFPANTAFSIETTIANMHNIILMGNAEIFTTNPNNRYIKCHKQNNPAQEVDFTDVGDLSSFCNAVLRAKYVGIKPNVVFIGDSIFMGGHNYHDYTSPTARIEKLINDAVGVSCRFHNRAIAGSNIGEVIGVIPSYANTETTHAPGEAAWITNASSTWLSYIAGLAPDLVVIGFGMNSDNSYDVQDVIAVRAALKSLSSAPSLIWVSTPMRTIDASKFLGTYPGNEYSNSAGISYAMYARYIGDTVIDVNRASGIVMLGIDNASAAIFPEKPERHKITGGTSSAVGLYISATLESGGVISSTEYTRDCAVEFRVTNQGGG